MMGDTYEFDNADATKNATLICKVECVPPTPGYQAGFVLQSSDPTQAAIRPPPGRSASFPISAAEVAADASYTLNVTPAATAAGGTFTVKISMVQGAGLGGTVYATDPNAVPPSYPMQLDGNGFVAAETGVVSGHQTYYAISIVSA